MGASQKRKELRKHKFESGAAKIDGADLKANDVPSSESSERKVSAPAVITSPKAKTKPEGWKKDLPRLPAKKKRKIDAETEDPKRGGGDSKDAAEAGNEGNVKRMKGGEDRKEKAGRFTVFIGNLPYTATTPAITAHFAAIKPSAVRHRTDQDSGKSKGFAFLEFDNYDRMKTCLKLYHHSVFHDGEGDGDGEGGEEGGGGGEKKETKKKKKAGEEAGGRRLNVELTAGGGGTKSTHRKTKLRAKNEKLNEERKRRGLQQPPKQQPKQGGQEKDLQAREGEEGEGGEEEGEEGKKMKQRKRQREEEEEKRQQQREEEEGAIHPSRRGRVPLG